MPSLAPSLWFLLLSVVGALVVLRTAQLRSPLYVRFVAVLMTLQVLLGWGVAAQLEALLPALFVLQALVFVHFVALSRPRLRPLAYRLLVSLPASFFVAGTWLSLFVLPLVWIGAPRGLLLVPYGLAVIGLVQSLGAKREAREIVIDRARVDGRVRWAAREGSVRPHDADDGLRIVQITDPHLGPFMPVSRLRAICERAVAKNPDLVLLTGDFLTMESQDSPVHLTRAFEPLAALPGRVFACNGNHDHEAPQIVKAALTANGIEHLVDSATVADTRLGPVQIVGMDYHWRARAEKLRAVCEKHPRLPGVLRLVLLHDPGAFDHLPEGEGDLVFSGHTHGGQLGLVSLGFVGTALRLFVDMPDHGLWARGRDRLYVHRGTGHYGFPLRIGVPAEESELVVSVPDKSVLA